MEFCRAGHIPRRGWGGFAVVAHIAIAWDMRIIARAETRIPQPKAVRVADALAGVRRRGGERRRF